MEMELRCLKKLKSIWKLPDQLGKQELEAMVSSFQSLRKMKIHECNELEEIFTLIEFKHRKYDGLLSELVKLELVNLPKLKYIWKGPHQAYSLNNLTNIHLNKCNGLTCLFTSTSVRSLDKLQCLKLVECGALETIIKLDDPSEQMSFLEIKQIHIESCEKLESILPISLIVGDRLPKLESMFIQNCIQLKQVFSDGDVNMPDVGMIKMDKLLCLALLDLPSLYRLLPENYNLNFPALSKLKVNSWFITKLLVTKHAGGLIPTEDMILQEEMPANAQIILKPLSLRRSKNHEDDPFYFKEGVFLNLAEVVEESNDMFMKETHVSSKHIFFEESINSALLRLPLDDHLASISFNKLQTVNIYGCYKLRSLFTLSMLRALPELRVLKIRYSTKLEHIIDTNDEDCSNVSESACFPRLEWISIEYCNNLRSIWPLSLIEALSCLQKLLVRDAKKLEYIISDDIRNGNDCREFQVIKLPNLQNLELYGVPSLVSVTPDNYHVDCPCLRSLCFYNKWNSSGQEEQKWHKSKRLLPIKASQSLMDIKSLELNFFEAVHEVFDLKAGQQPVLEKLEVLKLHQFPDLQYIWKEPTRFIRLSNLREIEASYCGAIKSLFPQRVAQTLNSLTTITVRFCKELEHIIEPSDLEDESASSGHVTLSDLKEIVVEDCMVLQSIFTFSVAQTLSSLTTVTIRNCAKFKHLIEPYDDLQDEFGEAETCFQQLEKLAAHNCKNLQTIFPLSLVSALPELKLLEINSCPILKTLFQDDVGEQRNSTSLEHIRLQNLKTLILIALPSLKSIAPPSYHVLICSSLRKLCLLDTKDVVYTDSEDEVYTDTEDVVYIEDEEVRTPLQGKICKKSIGILPLRVMNEDAVIKIENFDAEEVFNLEDYENGQIGESSFANLVNLRLSCLPNLRNGLFSSTLAQTLCLLETLQVINCKELLNLIEPPSIHPSNSSSAVINCFVPRLVCLHVEGCDRLRKIFPVSVTVKLPRLRKITIKRAQLLEEIFAADSTVVGHTTLIELPELTAMHLEELPCLYSFCPEGYYLSFRPESINLEIRNCPSLGIVHATYVPLGFVPLNTMCPPPNKKIKYR